MQESPTSDAPLTESGDRHFIAPATIKANLDKLSRALDIARKEGESFAERITRREAFFYSVIYALSAHANPADLDYALEEGRQTLERIDANQKQKCAP